LLGVFSLFALWATIFGFGPVYADRLGATSGEIGIITMLALGSSAAASMLAAYLTRYRSNSLLILAGSAISALAIGVIPGTGSLTMLGAMMLVFGLGSGLVNTVLMAVSVQYIEQEQRATAMGVYQAIYAVGMFLGPLVSGSIADRLGLTSVFYISAGFCLAVAGLAHLPVLTGKGHEGEVS
jgi:MFS family permease